MRRRATVKPKTPSVAASPKAAVRGSRPSPVWARGVSDRAAPEVLAVFVFLLDVSLSETVSLALLSETLAILSFLELFESLSCSPPCGLSLVLPFWFSLSLLVLPLLSLELLFWSPSLPGFSAAASSPMIA